MRGGCGCSARRPALAPPGQRNLPTESAARGSRVIAQGEPMSVAFESDYAPGVASPLQIAWRRKALVLLGLVSSLAIGTLYFAKSPPVYSSTAQILVVKKQPD